MVEHIAAAILDYQIARTLLRYMVLSDESAF